MSPPSRPERAGARFGELGHWWKARWKLIAVGTALAGWSGIPADRGSDLDVAVRETLALDHALVVDTTTALHWIDAARQSQSCWRGGTRVALLARAAPDALRDVYLVRVELSPEGKLLRSCGVYNLTATTLADEAALTGSGKRIAWQLVSQNRSYRLEYADLESGLAPEMMAWPGLARWQWRLTQLQDTGQLSGAWRRSFRVEPAALDIALGWSDGALEIRADGRAERIPTARSREATERLAPSARGIIEEPRSSASPGNLLTWAVDRARAVPWLGTERIQWLKAVGFAALDRLERAVPTLVPNELDAATLAPDVPLQEAERKATAPATIAAGEPSVFPPAPLAPFWTPAVAGEGQWRSLADDAFIKSHSGLPPAFATTFIRPDARLETARVVVVVWDPRRADLHFVAGTEEPHSATGEIGTGLIPRAPAVLERLLGAFNGGFQTAHGEFGTQVDGKLLVPPRPYAATVARFDDGAIGFGTWPRAREIPSGIESFRQNLTPLVSGGVLNPYGRQWWGGVPLGWMDVTRTVRSALCQTEDGFIGYFYGSRVDHEALGRALLMSRCKYGLHLDMNAGHTGFEFYSVVDSTEPPLSASELDSTWKAEARVPELPDLRFRSRRLFRNMQLMHFPRYIQRQARDFFYLTERALLPAPNLGSGAARAHTSDWQPLVAEAGGFPQLLARALVHPDTERPETTVRLLALDLKFVAATLGAATPVPSDAMLSVAAPTENGVSRVLWIGEHAAAVAVGSSAGGPVIARESLEGANAAWGVKDRQILIYAEVIAGRDAHRDGPLLDRLLARAGASERLLTSAPNFIAIEGRTDPAGQPVDLGASAARGQAALHFRPHAWQALRTLFRDTEIVDPETWQAYQP